MKKFMKIIFYNILLIFIIFIAFELFFDVYRLNVKYRKISRHNPSYTFSQKIYFASKELFTAYIQNKNYYKINMFRSPLIAENKKPAIILVGCSYTYGERIKNDETLGYHIYKNTDSTVYNMGLNGASPREILYMLRDDTSFLDKFTNNNNNISIILYTFIDDHLRRLYSDSRPRVPRYKLKNGELIYLQPIPHSELIQNVFYDNITKIIPISEQYKLFNNYMININNAIKNKFGYNTKFVIFIYDERHFKNPNWKELEDKGIKIIKLENLTDKNIFDDEYLAYDGYHPNHKAWNIICPKLIDKMLNFK